jgi:hypothetical protein
MGVEKGPVNITSGLYIFQKTLGLYDIDYRIVGSMAIDSYKTDMGNNKARTTDLDLLVTRSDYLKMKSPMLRNQLNFDKYIRYDSSISKYIDFRPNENYSFLVFRELRMPVKSELFEPRENMINDQAVKTIPAITLFHTFSVCGGILRPKDWGKILQLGRYVRNNPDEKFSEEDFTNFHKFLDIRSKSYPSDIWLLKRLQVLLSYSPTFSQDIALRIRKRIAKNYLGSSKDWE